MVKLTSIYFAKEVAYVTLLTVIIGSLVTLAIMYANDSNFDIKRYTYWKGVALAFFCTAILVHVVYALLFRRGGF
jgi:hypothetical protein